MRGGTRAPGRLVGIWRYPSPWEREEEAVPGACCPPGAIPNRGVICPLRSAVSSLSWSWGLYQSFPPFSRHCSLSAFSFLPRDGWPHSVNVSAWAAFLESPKFSPPSRRDLLKRYSREGVP